MSTSAPEKVPSGLSGSVDRYFKISERGSTIGTEIRGGLVTFFAMCYIIILNPLIIGLNASGSGTFLGGGENPDLAPIAATTALVAGVLTIVMGLVANFPMAIAAGLGLNAVVAFSIAALPDMTYADAMGIVVLEGIIILLLVLTGFRQAVFNAVPAALKTAIGVGIGLFIAFIGLVNAGFVSQGAGTPVELGTWFGHLNGWPVLVFIIGFFTVVVLSVRKVKGAIFYGIVFGSVLAFIVQQVADLGTRGDPASPDPKGWGLNAPELPDSPVATPDFSLIGQVSIFGSIEKIGILAVILLVFSLMLADFFDTMGTMVAVGKQANLLDDKGNPPKTKQILIVDSVAAAAGGAGGVSSNTAYIESTTGVAEGARTGFAAVVTGVCFLLATFLSPLVSLVPYEAAAPALVFVGFLMMLSITEIDWKSWDIALPAFLTIAIMPFTYSISAGIGAGFVSYLVVKLAKGKVKEIHPLMWITGLMFVAYFAIEPIKMLIN